MKKEFNVNGTKFTVDVQVEAEDKYSTIESDYKKLLYLLGQVSIIGSKLDREFTTRNANLESWKQSVEEGFDNALDAPYAVEKGLSKLQLSTREKNTVLTTIDSTMWWYGALRNSIEKL